MCARSGALLTEDRTVSYFDPWDVFWRRPATLHCLSTPYLPNLPNLLHLSLGNRQHDVCLD